MNQLVEETLDRLIENIEAAGDWRRTWLKAGMPRNFTTKASYHGINILLLWSARAERDYPTHEWATYKQWAAAGYQVKQGEKSTTILIVKDAVGKEKEDGTRDHYKMFRCAFVFNAAQLTEPPAVPVMKQDLTEDERHRIAQEVVDACGPSIVGCSDQPHYNKSIDVIGMPKPELFANLDAYHATMLHELVHWTGHSSRLDREMGQAGKVYAFEELIAELGCTFLCLELGLDETPGFDNHAAYLSNWLTFFKEDKATALMRAASAASKAHEYVRELANKERIAA